MRARWKSLRETIAMAQKGVREFLAVVVPVFRPLAPAIGIIVALLALDVLIDGAYPFLYGKLTDALVQKDVRGAAIFFGILFGQGIFSRVASYIRERYEIEHIDWNLNLGIMTSSLERISGFSMAQCANVHSGKTRTVVQNGRSAIRQIVYMAIYRFGPTCLELLVALIALFWTKWQIGAVAVASTLAYLTFAIMLFAKYRKPLKDLEDRNNENSKLFADTLTNMEVVMAYARQRRTVSDFDADGQECARQGRTLWRTAIGWFYARNGFAFVAKYALMGLTAYMLFQGQFSYGAFVAITQWSMHVMIAMQDIGQMQREISYSWAHAELYIQLLQKKPEIASDASALRPTSLRGDISFEHVTFHYDSRPSDDPLSTAEPVIALNDVTFTIPSGQKVALVGESGAGKSTVAYALMRARDPKAGVIRLDGIDLRTMDIDTTRRRMGIVQQHPRLFDQTLRYNLLFGLNEDDAPVSDERLHELLAMVKLEHLCANGGLDRRLGESGYTLSGGERQRLCIARALIKNPDILIFDEATSSLDPVNEKKVQDAIDAACGRTKIIIAHRYSTIRSVDRILVFDSGRLVADGTHDTLLATCRYYQTLLEQQGLREPSAV